MGPYRIATVIRAPVLRSIHGAVDGFAWIAALFVVAPLVGGFAGSPTAAETAPRPSGAAGWHEVEVTV